MNRDTSFTHRFVERLRNWGHRVANAGPTLRSYVHETRYNVRDRLRDEDPKVRAGAIVGLTLAGFMVLILAGWITLLVMTPDPGELESTRFAQATIAYTADGEELTRYHDENRVWVPLDSISTHVVEALLATEDHRFHQHIGVDVRRLLGAARRTLSGDPQGGSTVTMQLARNAFPEIWDDPTPIRKAREVLTALRMEEAFPKEKILEMYLNTVPFIYNAFGIEAASKVYFQKSAYDLDPLESAVLVGMLKGTVYYNPVRNPERSYERRNVVLGQMAKFGYLDAATRDSLVGQETLLRFTRPSRADGPAPHFAEHVRRWLDEWAERNGFNLYTDGLRVYTTIDSRMQQAAQAAAEKLGADLQAVSAVEWSQASIPYFSSEASDYRNYQQRVRPFGYLWDTKPELLDHFIRETDLYQQAVRSGEPADSVQARFRADAAFIDSLKASQPWLDVGFVAMDPHNGHVKAWVGGRDFNRSQYDHVAQAKRQPGSTFKPFVYLAALERGFRPYDRLPDSVMTYRDPGSGRTWSPENVGGGASGRLVTLKDALAYSKNTVTAQLVAEVGPDRVAQAARRLGIKSELDEVPSIGLGTSPVTLLEMATAYSTLADQGRYHEPVIVTRIENRYGQVLATFSASSRTVLSGYMAQTVLDMMRGVVDYGTGVRIRNQYGMRGDLAGKTGTSQDGADGWFMLLHPNLVAGAWVGFSSPAVHFRSDYWGQGAHNALHIVGTFYREARRTTDEWLAAATFDVPPGYQPLEPPDTLSFADSLSYAYNDSLSYRVDSLMARADSLLAQGRDRERTADSLVYRWGADSRRQPQDTVLEDENLDLGATLPDSTLTPADSSAVSRSERTKPVKMTELKPRKPAGADPDSTDTRPWR